MTPRHIEDGLLGFFNLLHSGAPKVWEFLSGEDGDTYTKTVLCKPDDAAAVAAVYKKNFHTFVGDEASSSAASIAIQFPGQLMVGVGGHTWHTTTSCGASLADACNYSGQWSSPAWLDTVTKHIQGVRTHLKAARFLSESQKKKLGDGLDVIECHAEHVQVMLARKASQARH
jgi:hypothetical protein